MITYVVPARKGSKGMPHKNRRLLEHFDYESIKYDLVVFSDDEWIEDFCFSNTIPFIWRPDEVSQDTTSTKETMLSLVERLSLSEDDIVVMLYLTYPERKVEDIKNALDFFHETKAKSLLCRKNVSVSPFLTLLKSGEHGGEQLIPHDYYRRQDYPECFEVSHYICIFKVSELHNLNSNLYNKETVFFPINNVVDVDTEKDYEQYKSNS
jgi:N-acylneuraminate cytidylyltransferase